MDKPYDYEEEWEWEYLEAREQWQDKYVEEMKEYLEENDCEIIDHLEENLTLLKFNKIIFSSYKIFELNDLYELISLAEGGKGAG